MQSIRPTLTAICASLALCANAAPAAAQTSSPYNGTPKAVPGIIEVEAYDNGGEGIGYHDTDSVNSGGQYRQDGVDISAIPEDGAGGQYSVGWLATNEWLKYTINVTKPGLYNLKIRGNLPDYQSSNPTSYLVTINGAPITGNTSTSTFQNYYGYWGWQGWSTSPKPTDSPTVVNLPQGLHTLKITITQGGGGGLNYLILQPANLSVRTSLSYPQAGQGQVYYVAPTGNDANPGTIAQPWKSITKATATAQAGNTIYFRQGIYKERFLPQNSGSPDNYIIYKNYSGETPVISGSGVQIPQLEGLIQIDNKSYIQISGFTIQDTFSYWQGGISVDESDHIIIDHNLIKNIYTSGISTSRGSHQILIDANTLTNTNTGPDDTEVSLGTYWYAYDIEIRNNYLHSSQGEGIGVAAGPNNVSVHGNRITNMGLGRAGAGIYVDAWTEYQRDIDVFNNLVYNNPDGIGVANEGGGLTDNIRVYNNLLYNTGWAGQIGVVSWANADVTSSRTHPIKNVYIYNNTLTNINSHPQNGSVFINNWEVENIVVKNNILNSGYCSSYNTIPTNGVCIKEIDCSQFNCNNIVSNLSASNNISSSAFVNPSSADFHLAQNATTAIDKADSQLVPPFDFDFNARPAGLGYDIGAYEYGSRPYLSPTPTGNLPPPLAGDLDLSGHVDFMDILKLMRDFSNYHIFTLNTIVRNFGI
jgi:hypothetical protein